MSRSIEKYRMDSEARITESDSKTQQTLALLNEKSTLATSLESQVNKFKTQLKVEMDKKRQLEAANSKLKQDTLEFETKIEQVETVSQHSYMTCDMSHV